MAERLFRQLAGDRHKARSAGSEPGTAPHPQVVEALARSASTPATTFRASSTTEGLVVGRRRRLDLQRRGLPGHPGVRRINWHLPDPKDLPLEEVRPIRDEIERLVGELVDELDQAATAA